VAKSLVIVESPAKAKTINKFLGREYTVKASMGHVRDLPAKSLAVDVDKNFAPKYEVVPGRKDILADLKKAAKTATAIYLAADPDREGEAICWLAHEPKSARSRCSDVQRDHEAGRDGRPSPTPGTSIAQGGCTAGAPHLDRLVGYKISPLVGEGPPGHLCGRVHRWRCVWWRIAKRRSGPSSPRNTGPSRPRWHTPMGSGRHSRPVSPRWTDGQHPSQAEADRILAALQAPGTTYRVATVTRKEKRRNPVPPFTTSKLQQEAVRKLRHGQEDVQGGPAALRGH
jgi:DNA topoisomerase-1